MLQMMVRAGEVEVVSKEKRSQSTDDHSLETIYKECATGLYYHLVEYAAGGIFLWGSVPRPGSESPTALQ